MVRYPFVIEVVELVALIAELYCHITVDAGLLVTIHLNVALMPSVNDVEDCIELAVSNTCWAMIARKRNRLKL